MTIDDMKAPIWTRQKRETQKAYAAFKIYRDMPYGAFDPILERDLPPDSRSLAHVGRILGKSTTQIENWSASWHWVNRVAAYDLHLDSIDQYERQRARRAMSRMMEERSMQYREDAAALYNQMASRITEMLSFPISESEMVAVVSDDGTPTGETMIVVKPVKWNASTIARFIHELREIARFAAGHDAQGILDKMLDRIDPATLTEDQRRRIIGGEDIAEVIFSGGEPEIPDTGFRRAIQSGSEART